MSTVARSNRGGMQSPTAFERGSNGSKRNANSGLRTRDSLTVPSEFTKQITRPSDEPTTPSSAASIRPPIESSIWDWDAPCDRMGDSATNFYFEPQGELAHEQRDHRISVTDFKVPSPGYTAGVSQISSDSNQESQPVSRRPSSCETATIAGVKRKAPSDREVAENYSQQSEPKRAYLARLISGEDGQTPFDMGAASESNERTGTGSISQDQSRTDAFDARQDSSTAATRAFGVHPGTQESRHDTSTTMALPARNVFPIQVGDQLFRLSGASISSDGQSSTTCDTDLTSIRLTFPQRLHTFLAFSKSSSGRMTERTT